MARPQASSHGGLRSAAVFALCGLFAFLAMGLSLLSSGVYRSTVDQSEDNYTHRTALSYLVNQVHRFDTHRGVALGAFGSSPALILTEELGESRYVTLLYCLDGQLRELYTEEGSGLTPADGMAILPLDALDCALEGDTITLTVRLGEASYTATVTPRSGVEEVGQV